MQNKIFTTLNQKLGAQIYSILDSGGTPVPQYVLEGFPLGTHNNAEDGELGGKVIVIATRGPGSNDPTLSSGMPYNAAEADYTNDTAGPTSIVYKDADGNTLATRTITYVDSTVANSPIEEIQDVLP